MSESQIVIAIIVLWIAGAALLHGATEDHFQFVPIWAYFWPFALVLAPFYWIGKLISRKLRP